MSSKNEATLDDVVSSLEKVITCLDDVYKAISDMNENLVNFSSLFEQSSNEYTYPNFR